ncbi:unnamed protein product, partial [Closterium sp. NIES-65]
TTSNSRFCTRLSLTRTTRSSTACRGRIRTFSRIFRFSLCPSSPAALRTPGHPQFLGLSSCLAALSISLVTPLGAQRHEIME